jgi:lipopolysaccharide/colanic/teichoic acid biosynthesis glycosyltransferase
MGLDRVLAVILGVVLSPVVVVLAAVVRRHDPGPGLIRLARVGRNGQPFRQWKPRTMRMDEGVASGQAITSAADPRVTPFGRRLRRYRLDEFPQLLNVVTGQMALVGPRPETPSYVDLGDSLWQEVLQAGRVLPERRRSCWPTGKPRSSPSRTSPMHTAASCCR